MERQTEIEEMQFSNFSLDTYCALALLEALRRENAADYASGKPIVEKPSLLSHGWKRLRARFSRPAAPVFANVERFSDIQGRARTGQETPARPVETLDEDRPRKAV